MNNLIVKYLLFVCLVVSTTYSQNLRIKSMADITLPVYDIENSFNPYYMGNNISFLTLAGDTTWLKISPSFNSDWGDYKRPFDPEKTNVTGINFTEVKSLGEKGTYSGSVDYQYDSRTSLYQSLKYNTYGGDAFFMNIHDTLPGDLLFYGPTINFGYSVEPLPEVIPNLYIGASAGYRILNGIKRIDNIALSVLRNVNGSFGLTYKVTKDIYLTAGISGYNSQESVSAHTLENTAETILNYHGDFYSITVNGNPVEEKIKENGYSYNSQLYYHPTKNSELGINFVYSNSNQKLLIPYTIDKISIQEYEDGYSNLNNYLLELKGRYELFDGFTLGIMGGYYYNRGWSELPADNLLIWDWNVKTIAGGVGVGYYLLPSLLVSAEYNIAEVKADSSKYIDNNFTKINSTDQTFRIGTEYEAWENIYLRAGYVHGIIPVDIAYGARNINYDQVTFGLGINIFSAFSIDILLDYNNYKPKQINLTRKFFEGLVSFKLLNI